MSKKKDTGKKTSFFCTARDYLVTKYEKHEEEKFDEVVVFAADSDLHYKDLRPKKEGNVDKIKASGAELLIVAGDLTDQGTDGTSPLCCIGAGKNHLGPFIDEYLTPITEAGIPVYLCIGNHDNVVPKPYIYKPVVDFVKKRHGGLTYSFDYKGLHFACCHIYPDQGVLNWLKKDLKKIEGPIVLFFHYNLFGDYSNWWARDKGEDPEIAEERKEAFFEVIKDKPIKLIITGHRHTNAESIFLPEKYEKRGHKGFPTIIVGGEGYTRCTWNGVEMFWQFNAP